MLRAAVAVLSLALLSAGCAHAPPAGEPAGATVVAGDVPFVPTPPEVVSAMLRLAEVRGGDVVYDLGCGDGRIVIAAARDHGARGVGIELDPALVAEAERAAARAGVSGLVSFRQADLLATDLGEATVVTLYLGDKLNLLLRAKLLSELRPGARIVSHNFAMGDWRPDEMARAGWHQLYRWNVPQQVPAALRTISPREAERVGELPY
jgi:precorrin-6B methylase 2